MSDATPKAPEPEDAASVQPAQSETDFDTGADVVDPPSGPVSARGHLNQPASSAGAAPADADAAPVLPPFAEPQVPVPSAVEPAPVVSSGDDVAAAVARSAAEEPVGPTTVLPAPPIDPSLAQGSTTPVIDQGVHPGSATTGYAPGPVTPIFVNRPTPPARKSNRGFGILLALVGTVVFAVLWTAVAALIGVVAGQGRPFDDEVLSLLGTWGLWIPIVFFFVAMVVLIQIINLARWWAYILGGLFVAAFVYGGFVGGSVLDQPLGRLTPDDVAQFLSRQWLNPYSLLAAIIAREVSVWTGAWLAARSRKLKQRNADAQADYDQQLADAQNQAIAAYTAPSGY